MIHKKIKKLVRMDFSFVLIKNNIGQSSSAGSSITIHPNLLSIKYPHLFEVCLPYGALYFRINGNEIIPIAIHE